MADDTLLTWKTRITVRQLKDWIAAEDRDHIAEFLRHRFVERYFDPLQGTNRNGFLLMAISCLVVETLESFWNGWPSTDRYQDKAFIGFFIRHARFQQFKPPIAQMFYRHVRCGILHQGETTGGWTITRNVAEPLLDGKKVNADKFHDGLRLCLDEYVASLKTASITDELWTNCLMKLWSTIRNCD